MNNYHFHGFPSKILPRNRNNIINAWFIVFPRVKYSHITNAPENYLIDSISWCLLLGNHVISACDNVPYISSIRGNLSRIPLFSTKLNRNTLFSIVSHVKCQPLDLHGRWFSFVQVFSFMYDIQHIIHCNICNYMAFNENKLEKDTKSFSPWLVKIWNVNFHFRNVNFHSNLEIETDGLFRSDWVNWISMGQKNVIFNATHSCLRQ